MKTNNSDSSWIDDLLFFQSAPMSGNMLADWQIAQAKQKILQKMNEARIEAYRSVPEVRGLTEEGLEDVNRWLWARIDELTAQLKSLESKGE